MRDVLKEGGLRWDATERERERERKRNTIEVIDTSLGQEIIWLIDWFDDQQKVKQFLSTIKWVTFGLKRPSFLLNGDAIS